MRDAAPFVQYPQLRMEIRGLAEHAAGHGELVPPAGIFFATLDDRPVGTASTYLHLKDQGVDPELGWVVVDPRHRARGLGLLVCQAVLDVVRVLDHDHAYLLTDDFRLPAIKTYLRLGFEPVLVDPSHPARWA